MIDLQELTPRQLMVLAYKVQTCQDARSSRWQEAKRAAYLVLIRAETRSQAKQTG